MLALAEQYLEFVEAARRVRLELAADYLVMAAWLAYLKSRLLLPSPPKGDEPAAARTRRRLAQRLRRLEAIRTAAEQLVDRPHIGRDIFLRGAPEGSNSSSAAFIGEPLRSPHRLCPAAAEAGLVEGDFKSRRSGRWLRRASALERLVGVALEWTVLDDFLIEYCDAGAGAHGARLDFSASLEMVKRRADRPAAGSRLRAALGAAQGRRKPPALACGIIMADELKAVRFAAQDASISRAARNPRGAARSKRIIEALLFAAGEPLDEKALAKRLPEGADLGALRWPSARRIMRRAASISRASARNGFSARQPISPGCCREQSSRGSCRARPSKRSRSSPITSR